MNTPTHDEVLNKAIDVLTTAKPHQYAVAIRYAGMASRFIATTGNQYHRASYLIRLRYFVQVWASYRGLK